MSPTIVHVQPPPLPKCVPSDSADQARRRLVRKSFLRRFLSLPAPRRHHPNDNDINISIAEETEPTDTQPITLSGVNPVSDVNSQDRFAWAVLYENQRGMTVFSTPYYSHRSLIPMDPAPFTLPSALLRRSKQPFTSLNDYQLPDGTWRWVSKSWMIDMRSENGEIQYDGFEYNWFFRRHHWRAQVGALSAGGLVRRRRWIRLMMRPAKQYYQDEDSTSGQITQGAVARRPDTTICPSGSLLYVDGVWQAQDNEGNWNRCHALMKRLDRDGHKLDVWLAWLKPLSESVDDNKGSSSEHILRVTNPRKQQMMPILHRHMGDILRMFIFPESRARLLEAAARAGMEVGTLPSWEVDFWSYRDELRGLM